MSRPLRIVHILEKNRFDTGSVHQMFQAAAGLRERGHDVTVVTRPGEEMETRCRDAGIRFRPMALRNALDFSSMRDLAGLFARERTEVIHVHKGMPHTLALAATWRRRVPAFVVNRGVSFDLTVWNRPKYATRRVDRIVTVCEDIRRVVVRSGRVPEPKVDVIYAGTDVTLFDPERWNREQFRAERGVPSDLFVFATVGIRDWKGWREVIDAVAAMNRRGEPAGVLLIGCKTEEQRLEVEGYAADRGIQDLAWAVEARPDMPRVLSAADCIVDASSSGTGITGTIREGMALERSVIATDCGGNRELVDQSVGWLIPARDPAALLMAMSEVRQSPEAARQRAKSARARVVSGFSREVRLDALERLYRSIVESKAERLEG